MARAGGKTRDKDHTGAGRERRAAVKAVGQAGTERYGSEGAGHTQGTGPIFLHCLWAQGQSLSWGQSITSREGIGEQKVRRRGLAEARSVFLVCLYVCFTTRISN